MQFRATDQLCDVFSEAVGCRHTLKKLATIYSCVPAESPPSSTASKRTEQREDFLQMPLLISGVMEALLMEALLVDYQSSAAETSTKHSSL